MNGRAFLMAVSSTAVALALNATTYTSASYVQNGLIAQWDGIDNQGTGTHDPTATTWKDLKGNLDLTLMGNGRWMDSGKALFVDGPSATNAVAAPAYRTIELVLRVSKKGTQYNQFVFSGGNADTRQMVVSYNQNQSGFYFSGWSANHKVVGWPLDMTAVRFIAATYTNASATAATVYEDGAEPESKTQNDSWSSFNKYIMLGDRQIATSAGNRRDWCGEIYAIRLYDRELAASEISANAAIDRIRFLGAQTSSYVQDGLVVQWDAENNAGTGFHDSSATIWKDLKGTCDLTLTNSAVWNAAGNALVANGISAVGAPMLPDYQTIEVVYKMKDKNGRIMFNSAKKSRFVIFDPTANSTCRVYFSGDTKDDNRVVTKNFTRPAGDTNEICFAAALYNGGNIVDDLYCDGAHQCDGEKGNEWAAANVVCIGGRPHSDPAKLNQWTGEVYTVRLYNRRLTKAELAHNNKIDRLRFLNSASYEGRNSLLSQWDGVDNADRYLHNANAETWKDLVGGRDLTLTTNGSWNAAGNALVVANCSAVSAAASEFTYKSIEVAYKMTTASGRFLFTASNPNTKQSVIFDDSGKKAYFSGLSKNHKYVLWTFDANAVRTMAATYADVNDTASAVYGNGVLQSPNSYSNDWYMTDKYIRIGDRYSQATPNKPWFGEIYAIRLYSEELTAAQIAFNSSMDRKRVAFGMKTFTWGGADGIFTATNGNWQLDGATTRKVPRYMDSAVLPAGNYVTSLEEDWVVCSLSVGAGAKLSLTVPADTGVVPLTVLGAVAAESGAGLVLNAAAFSRKHPEESITIVECEKDSAAALQALADNLSFVNTGRARQGTVAVADGKKLVYTAPHKPGTSIVIQ